MGEMVCCICLCSCRHHLALCFFVASVVGVVDCAVRRLKHAVRRFLDLLYHDCEVGFLVGYDFAFHLAGA